MKNFAILFILFSITVSACKQSCDPGTSITDKALAFNITKNGRTVTKTTGGAGTSIVPDSVKFYALGSTTALPLSIVSDSILFFSDYARSSNVGANNLSYRFVIGNLKPDTINVNIIALQQRDNCGRDYKSYDFGALKVNNVSNATAPTLIAK